MSEFFADQGFILIFSEHNLRSDYAQKNRKTNHGNKLKIGRHRFSGTENPLRMSKFCQDQVLMLTFNEHEQKSAYAQKN